MAPAPEEETKDEAEARKQEDEQRRKEYEAEQERRAEERRQEEEREQQEYEAEQARREELRQARENIYKHLLDNAPASFSAAQLRVVLRALVNLDPYTFADDLADELTLGEENKDAHRTAEEVLLAAVDSTADERLTRFALQLAFSGHRGIPREGEPAFLAEAERALHPTEPEKKFSRSTKAKKPTLVTKAKSQPAKTVKAA